MTMRWIVTDEFSQLICPLIDKINKVAIVGGSCKDPEMRWLKKNRPSVQFYYFGIEPVSIESNEDEGFSYFDLNQEQDFQIQEYDLVFCAQVLEHVWDVKQALYNLVSLTAPGGYIFVNCPASCRAHGSPEYYSAGYQPQLLVNLLINMDVEPLVSNVVGSSRAYYFEHQLRRWPRKDEYKFPLRLQLSCENGFWAIVRWIFILPKNLVAMTKKAKPNSNIDTGIQTYVLARKPVDEEA